MKRRIAFRALVWLCLIPAITVFSGERPQPVKKAMTFMDVLLLKSIRAGSLSPDGRSFLYELSSLDWKENKHFSDLFLVSSLGGQARQMTFTKKKNESSPKWHPDSSCFAFLSDRAEKNQNQVFFMKPDGGEAWQVTEAKEGVISFGWNKDGSCLAFLTGKDKDIQLWILPSSGEKAWQLTKHETPVESWLWCPAGKKIYFVAPDRYDETDKKRTKEGFDANIINPEMIPRHVWVIDVESGAERRLTQGDRFSTRSSVISDDGRHITFVGQSTDRYSSYLDSEVYLLNTETGTLERLTENRVAEGSLSFSPDNRWLAYAAPADFTYMRKERIHLYPLAGGKTLVLPTEFDLDAGISFWSDSGDTIFFNTLEGTTTNLYAIRVAEGAEPIKVTDFKAQVFARRDKDTGLVLVNYSDPSQPTDIYLASLKTLGHKEKWVRLTEANTEVRNLALAEYENITWKSTDGRTIEGILAYPVDYEKGKRYPLIVQIHGGPAGAYTHSFPGSYGTYVHVFAADGYAVFQPNYRGSSGYGEALRMEIAGDYFRQAFDDIMTGVDYLVERGIADPDKLGFMGWSAGGHWSNWALVSTDRFKAISTGAGAVNWISLYAQTDMQDTREFYFKGTPYDNWDHYIEVSPLKYIKKARTPTLIHFGEKDPRIPRPQGDELHMALKKLGVPTEFIVYPSMPHGLTNARYQLVKMAAEFNWFEKWIKGKEVWLDWKTLLQTLGEEKEKEKEKD
jgi:dipeptidyl aminopeptidase/acylaminoacyl peptidase